MGAERVHQEIADLLKEAEEELNTDQMKWDRYLVQCFFEKRYLNTYYLSCLFKEENNMSEEDFFALKRTPRPFASQMRVGFARFISAYLPTIADVLWDQKKENIDKIALAINRSNVNTRTRECDVTKANQERNEISTSKSMNSRIKRIQHYNQLSWNSYKASNQWGVTK